MQIKRSSLSDFLDATVLGTTNATETCAEDFANHLPFLRKTVFERYSPDEAEELRLGMAYILAHPEMDWEDLTTVYTGGWYLGGTYELVEYLYKNLWPDQYPIPPETLRDVEVEPEDA